tara:strand:+ start:269 stop:487 length:219 start_codon:yes stop_codon:yes gene_type:complete
MKTKKITTLESITCKILENKKTEDWIEVRWFEKYQDGSIELWVYSGKWLSNQDIYGFKNLKELRQDWKIVID